MTEVKIVIGERSFSVACNPGEQSDVMASAKLLNIEADIIQEQLGRLPEDKLLLLSGLMIGDKLRTLNKTLVLLQEKIMQYEDITEDQVEKKENMAVPAADEGTGDPKLSKISESLDKILGTVAEYEKLIYKNKNEAKEKEVQNSFL